MYLVDTNIFLEALLEQEKTNIVRSFLKSTEVKELYITNFSLYSIGIVLFKLKKFNIFISFLNDVVVDGINIVSIGTVSLKELVKISQKLSLDFDDAYQYYLAKTENLQLISFDTDFDKSVGMSTEFHFRIE